MFQAIKLSSKYDIPHVGANEKYNYIKSEQGPAFRAVTLPYELIRIDSRF